MAARPEEVVPKTATRTTRGSGPQNSDQDNQGKYTFFFSADGPGAVNELYTELYTKLYIILYSKLYTKISTVASRCVMSDCQQELQNSGLTSSFFSTERWSNLFILQYRALV